MSESGAENKFNYKVTLNEAVKQFIGRDITDIAAKSGANLTPANSLELQFMGRSYNIAPEGSVSFTDGEVEVPIAEKILILHYLVHASDVALANKPISFKELPGGAIYITPFTNRSIRPLLGAFGEDPQALLPIAEKLAGKRANHGDVSVIINVFPRIPVTLILWAGDDEFPASGNILFDASAPGYLPTEDYAVLSGMLALRLRQLKNNA